MGVLRKTFRAVDAGDGSDGRWAAELRVLWPAAENALTEDGRSAEGAAAGLLVAPKYAICHCGNFEGPGIADVVNVRS